MKYCIKCGKQIPVEAEFCTYCGAKQELQTSDDSISENAQKSQKNMPSGIKTTKLVIGILMIILSVFIGLQSLMVGLGDTVTANGHQSGSQGIFVGLLFLGAGIVYIVTRKQIKMGADIAGVIIMLLSWLIAQGDVGEFTDLLIYAWMSFIIGVGFFVWHLLINRKAKKQ
ncbi:zinc-ribbon domain-containing protein [Pediococcus claussenii]|uniref:zinc-ribbon domain-containing protein n=1 Tax=Pediococcus claussenii TaxID=187452 RepID=UPI001E3ED1C7|nr:zinc ribbon domain-containing protein [Pediococcus claussenii]